jgi:D-amino-acid oxidase
MARDPPCDTTSSGAGGLWEPFQLGATDPGLVNAWGAATLAWLRGVAVSPDAGAAGVSEHALFQFWTDAAAGGEAPPPPAWAPVVPTFRPLPAATVARYEGVAAAALGARSRGDGASSPSPPPTYVSGWTFDTVTAQPTRYLPFLESLARAAGVELRYGVTVDSLADLASEYDAVAVCAGLGARELARDPALVPVRGQVERVAAPHVNAAYFVDELTYIIPNTDWCVLGGSATRGDERTTTDEGEAAAIIAKCATVLPALALAPRLGSWAGLRPVRSPVRVGPGPSLPRPAGSGAARDVVVVNCWGHGGAGVTLHWGCAGDVVAGVREGLGV